MESGHRSLRGSRQRDRKLGAVPRCGGSGNRGKNFERSSQRFPSIDGAGDYDRKRSGELDRAAGDLLVEPVAFGGGLTADEQ
jgi:hypothetical protein